ncbi:unnamed protein product [Darwinula stevensoni]|uniref:KASH domain-containing protein n=1 Tax=Darwinula stevensoni TaxID=69355 RepID=A0A7R9ABJ7_9CRUS|nr:unnamed protein product [Darwinula stevensoni]CAG0899237.1 unnamed protein product [Darwinula stevensoni]
MNGEGKGNYGRGLFLKRGKARATRHQEVGEELKQRGTEVRGVVGAWSGGEERGRRKKARGAEALERRWHRLILQALEAQFRLEAALRNAQQKCEEEEEKMVRMDVSAFDSERSLVIFAFDECLGREEKKKVARGCSMISPFGKCSKTGQETRKGGITNVVHPTAVCGTLHGTLRHVYDFTTRSPGCGEKEGVIHEPSRDEGLCTLFIASIGKERKIGVDAFRVDDDDDEEKEGEFRVLIFSLTQEKRRYVSEGEWEHRTSRLEFYLPINLVSLYALFQGRRWRELLGSGDWDEGPPCAKYPRLHTPGQDAFLNARGQTPEEYGLKTQFCSCITASSNSGMEGDETLKTRECCSTATNGISPTTAKLCQAYWRGPNCATFHFRQASQEPESQNSGQSRPRLVARVSPQRRVKGRLDLDDGSDGASADSPLKMDWTESSDSEWLNVGGLSDSDLSGLSYDTAEDQVNGNLNGSRHQERPISNVMHESSRRESTGSNSIADDEASKDSPRDDHETLKRSCSKESIHRLVNAAEDLIRGDAGSAPPPPARVARVKAWLRLQRRDARRAAKPEDSCDASGEYTSSADSDLESNNSEDLDGSVLTCRQGTLTNSYSGISDQGTPVADRTVTFESPKRAVQRRKKVLRGQRPWSVTELSLWNRPAVALGDTHQISNSESAIHSLSISPLWESAYEKTAVSEAIKTQENDMRMVSPAKNRKFLRVSHSKPLRPKNIWGEARSCERERRRSFLHHRRSPFSKARSNGIVKSKSFSGRMLSDEDVGETSEVLVRYHSDPVKGDAGKFSSGTEDASGPHLFPLGVESAQDHEGFSSQSEQAWDPYQAPVYGSDNYSEDGMDSDAVRRLLEFGDDYRNFLDSLSDATSGFNPPSSFRRSSLRTLRRKQMCRREEGEEMEAGELSDIEVDSDSEGERAKTGTFLSHSQKQLDLVTEKFHSFQAQSPPPSPGHWRELCWACEENIRTLESLKNVTDQPQVLELLREWKGLQEKVKGESENALKAGETQIAVEALKKILLSLGQRLQGLEAQAHSSSSTQHLSSQLEAIKEVLSELTGEKGSLFTVNMSVHGMMTAGLGLGDLRDAVVDLYRLWDDTHTRAKECMSRWAEALNVWKEAELALSDLTSSQSHDDPHLSQVESRMEEMCQRLSAAFGPLSPPVASLQKALLSIKKKATCPEHASSDTPAREEAWKKEKELRLKSGSGWGWRILRAAFPFQMLLVVLCWMAAVLEPRCCDAINNLANSWAPQLRYIRGNPPT